MARDRTNPCNTLITGSISDWFARNVVGPLAHKSIPINGVVMRIGDFGSIFSNPLNELESIVENAFSGNSSTASTPTSSGDLAPGQEVTIPNEESMPDYNQGQTNGCGTTSLAMIMTYLGIPETQGDVDGAIRRMNIFTSPTDILDFARSKGLSAEGYNH